MNTNIQCHNKLNQQAATLPTHETNFELANRFSKFFNDKIDTLRTSFRIDANSDVEMEPLASVKLNNLISATSDEIRDVIASCPNKSCQLDHIPTWLVKQCVDQLLPLLTSIINESLTNGEFPSDFKNAIVKPLLKKPSLDKDELKNYRPVSNLHFISKVIEKLVAKRLEEHMSEYSMYDPMQSAYKLVHSTETALVKINYDILSSLDAGKCTVLVSLDLSAAFDTINHNVFLNRLQYMYGITGTAFKWFQSYIEQRNNQVCVGDSLSQRRPVASGVPQGSVLGARLFTMYTYPLALIFNKHKVEYHSYADDTQVYLHCDNNVASLRHAVHQLENCIFDICDWMRRNALKLNEDKTEFVIFSTKNNLRDNQCLVVGKDKIEVSDYVKILGVTFDNRMTLQKHITNICRSVNMHIRKINSIRRYLSNTAVRTLEQSIVIARLDYCNSVCVGLPMNRLQRLQFVQNSAARVISQTKRYTSITPILNELHWLPINKRCQFKILLLTFKSLNGCAPEYLCDMLNVNMPNRSLRSTAFTSLVPYINRSIRLGKRLFGTSAAKLWNELPRNIQRADSITMFKKTAKNFHFFSIRFMCI